MARLHREELLESVERGEWKSVPRLAAAVKRYREYTESTFKKNRRVNIRLSGNDLDAIQKRAIEEGIPYQTLISSLVHKYATGKLVERFVRAIGRSISGIHVARQPATNMSWQNAQAYCEWAGGRLPSEAEWEYAERAGTATARYGKIDEIAWYSKDSGDGIPLVAQKKPNGWALYDMLGGVWEWTADNHVAYKDHGVLTEKEYRPGDKVLRGGYWRSSPEDIRASFRLGWAPSEALDTIGFRCLLETRALGIGQSDNPRLR